MKQKHIWVIFWRYEAKGLKPGETHIVACATKKDAAARVRNLRKVYPGAALDLYGTNVADPVRYVAKEERR